MIVDAAEEQPIALIGLMGAGKTVVAARLAARLSRRAVDLDAVVAAEAGGSIATLFATEGEAAFRERETRALEAELRARPAPILATGGGIVLRPRNRRLLGACRVVWLLVSPAEAARRIAGTDHRPLARGEDPEGVLAGLLEAREALYAAVAEVRLRTDGRSVDAVAAAVVQALQLHADH